MKSKILINTSQKLELAQKYKNKEISAEEYKIKLKVLLEDVLKDTKWKSYVIVKSVIKLSQQEKILNLLGYVFLVLKGWDNE